MYLKLLTNNAKFGSRMCCRLTRFLLKVGAVDYLLQIRKTNKGDSTMSNFPKGVVSENVLLSEPQLIPDLKTAPDFLKGLLQKNGAFEPLWCPLQLRANCRGGFDNINFSDGCRCKKLGAIEPLRFPKMRSAQGGSRAPNFIQGM